MPSTVTVTGTIGPGNSFTSAVYSNVESFQFVDGKELLIIKQTDGKITTVSIVSAATLTLTVSGSSYTLTVAN